MGNGHQLEIVRAGQFVAFECNAAAQPRPRVRWYRLWPLATGGGGVGGSANGKQAFGGLSATSLSSPYGHNNNNHHHHDHSTRLDESQIRLSLLQADNSEQQTGGTNLSPDETSPTLFRRQEIRNAGE